MCTISKDIGINKGKEIYLSNKELVSGHRCEKNKCTDVAAKCEMFMTCSKNIVGIFKKK